MTSDSGRPRPRLPAASDHPRGQVIVVLSRRAFLSIVAVLGVTLLAVVVLFAYYLTDRKSAARQVACLVVAHRTDGDADEIRAAYGCPAATPLPRQYRTPTATPSSAQADRTRTPATPRPPTTTPAAGSDSAQAAGRPSPSTAAASARRPARTPSRPSPSRTAPSATPPTSPATPPSASSTGLLRVPLLQTLGVCPARLLLLTVC